MPANLHNQYLNREFHFVIFCENMTVEAIISIKVLAHENKGQEKLYSI